MLLPRGSESIRIAHHHVTLRALMESVLVSMQSGGRNPLPCSSCLAELRRILDLGYQLCSGARSRTALITGTERRVKLAYSGAKPKIPRHCAEPSAPKRRFMPLINSKSPTPRAERVHLRRLSVRVVALVLILACQLVCDLGLECCGIVGRTPAHYSATAHTATVWRCGEW